MDQLVLQTNQRASHQSGPALQSRLVVRATDASPPFSLCAASTSLRRSSVGAHFHPRACVYLFPPASHGPALLQSLCISSSANSRLPSSLLPTNDCCSGDRAVWRPSPLRPFCARFSASV